MNKKLWKFLHLRDGKIVSDSGKDCFWKAYAAACAAVRKNTVNKIEKWLVSHVKNLEEIKSNKILK